MNQAPGSLPVYLQVTELLVRDIAANRLVDGERLQPERDMAEEMGIAVGTLRKALAELQKKGLLERVQGSGNYIRASSDSQSIYSMFRLELIGGGGLPTAEILSISRMDKPDDLPAFGTSPQAHRIRRLRRLSGKPAAIEEIWLDGNCVDHICLQEISESLYLYYRKKLGLWISKAEDHVSIGAVPSWAPEQFLQAQGATVPTIVRFSQSQEGEQVEFSRTWYDPEYANYIIRHK